MVGVLTAPIEGSNICLCVDVAFWTTAHIECVPYTLSGGNKLAFGKIKPMYWRPNEMVPHIWQGHALQNGREP